MASLNLIRSVSSSSTRPGPRPTWRGGMAVRPVRENGQAPEKLKVRSMETANARESLSQRLERAEPAEDD